MWCSAGIGNKIECEFTTAKRLWQINNSTFRMRVGGEGFRKSNAIRFVLSQLEFDNFVFIHGRQEFLFLDQELRARNWTIPNRKHQRMRYEYKKRSTKEMWQRECHDSIQLLFWERLTSFVLISDLLESYLNLSSVQFLIFFSRNVRCGTTAAIILIEQNN